MKLFYSSLVLLLLLSVNAQSFKGDWTFTYAAGVNTNIFFTVTDTNIKVDYNSSMNFHYLTMGKQLKINLLSSNSISNKVNKSPSENDLKNAILNFATYQLSGDTLTFKGKNGAVLATCKKGRVAEPTVQAPPNVSSPGFAHYPYQDKGLLKNKWKVQILNDYGVIFQVSISNDAIQFTFCNSQRFPFSIQGSNIRIQPVINSVKECPNYFPLQNIVTKAFIDADSYEVNQDFLYLKKGSNLLVLMQRIW